MDYRDTFSLRYDGAKTLGDLINVLEDFRDYCIEINDEEDLEECLDILDDWYYIIEKYPDIDVRNCLVKDFDKYRKGKKRI